MNNLRPEEDEQHSGGQAARALLLWRSYLTGDHSQLDSMTKAVRQFFRHLPSAPRC